METAFIAQRVNTQLRSTEAAIDAAILEATKLMAGVIEARAEANVSAVAGDRELTRLTEALKELNGARHNVVNVHHGLAKIAKELNVPVRMDATKPQYQAEETPPELRQAV
jgi:hypothetical protein